MSVWVLMARNNTWANATLLAACARLKDGEWEAARTGFFPSLSATLHHVHAVDLYYLDALEGRGQGPAAFTGAPTGLSARALAQAQADLDARLERFCAALDPDAAAGRVVTDRGSAGQFEERVDNLLLHLFQHQVHHRGQAHAMLSGSSVAPPQLDEFLLDFDGRPDLRDA